MDALPRYPTLSPGTTWPQGGHEPAAGRCRFSCSATQRARPDLVLRVTPGKTGLADVATTRPSSTTGGLLSNALRTRSA